MSDVILVDSKDQIIGYAEKMDAHKKGLLHRAFSIFLFNSKKELLIHRRAYGKYHSEGLWTNTCCSHPIPEISLIASANKRLMEEMGMVAHLSPLFSFIYHVALDNSLIEHELDHVLIGYTDESPIINPDEVCDFTWINFDTLIKKIDKNPELYTYWFKKICKEHLHEFNALGL